MQFDNNINLQITQTALNIYIFKCISNLIYKSINEYYKKNSIIQKHEYIPTSHCIITFYIVYSIKIMKYNIIISLKF